MVVVGQALHRGAPPPEDDNTYGAYIGFNEPPRQYDQTPPQPVTRRRRSAPDPQEYDNEDLQPVDTYQNTTPPSVTRRRRRSAPDSQERTPVRTPRRRVATRVSEPDEPMFDDELEQFTGNLSLDMDKLFNDMGDFVLDETIQEESDAIDDGLKLSEEEILTIPYKDLPPKYRRQRVLLQKRRRQKKYLAGLAKDYGVE